MPIVRHENLREHSLPGIKHRTVAGREQGTTGMEVWVQSIAPGASTPVHRHDCEEVIVVLTGAGRCTVEGRTEPFSAGSTLNIPRNAVHDLANTSAEEMHLVAALGMNPVRVENADGSPLPLPWDVAVE
jgi:quercetin dioxygenase-like cupin family protein